MKVIIPAAGYATRMYPLTLDKPKALLEIGRKPVIEHIIEKIVNLAAVDEIFIVTNNKFFGKFSEWVGGFKCKVSVKIVNDNTNTNEERLGTIGDIKYVIKSEVINEDILVVNSDNIFSFDLNGLYNDFIKRRKSVIGLFDVGDLEVARRMGNPYMDIRNKVIHFKEKDRNTKSTLCSVGIYYFPSSVIPLIDLYLREGNSPDRSGDFIEWLFPKEDVFGFVFDGKWYDIGSMDTFKEAERVFCRENKG